MNIRKFVLCAVACGAMASVSLLQAQEEKKGKGGRGGMPTVEQRLERLEQAVGSLTDTQKGKIKDLYAKAAEQMQGLSQEERREKGMEIMRESGKAIRDVLTADQQTKYDEMMAQGRGNRSSGGKGGKGKKDN